LGGSLAKRPAKRYLLIWGVDLEMDGYGDLARISGQNKVGRHGGMPLPATRACR